MSSCLLIEAVQFFCSCFSKNMRLLIKSFSAVERIEETGYRQSKSMTRLIEVEKVEKANFEIFIFVRVEVLEDFSTDHLSFKNYQRWPVLFQFWFSVVFLLKICVKQLWTELMFRGFKMKFSKQVFIFFRNPS